MTLKVEDTFNVWRLKINELMTGTVVGSFDHDETNTTNLNFGVGSGKLRLGSQVVNVSNATVSIPVSQTSIVALYTDPTVNEIRVYEESQVPKQYIIPLFRVISEVTEIISIEDLRTWVDLSGSANDTDGILTFSQNISFDRLVPEGKNALSIDPVVEDGVTVTVSPNSTWVVL